MQLIILFIAFVLAPSVLIGLEHSFAIALCVFSALSILFAISTTLRDVAARIERKEAWYLKSLRPEDQDSYWYARFRS